MNKCKCAHCGMVGEIPPVLSDLNLLLVGCPHCGSHTLYYVASNTPLCDGMPNPIEAQYPPCLGKPDREIYTWIIQQSDLHEAIDEVQRRYKGCDTQLFPSDVTGEYILIVDVSR